MTRSWLLLLVASVVTVVVAETVLLALGTGLLTSGYNTPRLDASVLWLGFLPASAVIDLWLVCAIWMVVIPLTQRASGCRLQVFAAAATAGVGIPLVLAAARYDLHGTFGGMFSVALASQFSKLGASDLAELVLNDAPYTVFGLGAFVGAAATIWKLAERWSRSIHRFRPEIGAAPGTKQLAAATLALTFLAVGVVVAGSRDEGLRYGFDRKLSGQALGAVVDVLSDVDRDGFGMLRPPVDPYPFDATRFPYAIDVPGNGIDENGIGGDHPLGVRRPAPDALPVAATGARPHVLVIYLESFRADLLGRRVAGRRVTPFLDRLAREGGSSRHAYAHAPWTLESRAQFFGGRLVNRPGESTIVDDFHARGYTVAHFSGQDDSYGGSVEVLGADRADAFYDARQDVDRRTSRSVAPVSLQVSWKTLTQRVGEYLDGYDARQPLFLYVNIVDTHYPYDHAELDPILEVERASRREIRADAARAVFETYANAAANVDRAVEDVVGRFRRAIGGGDHAILVTADHGEAFYEHGRLGHGQYLGEEETRVPFIVWGIGGDWPEPIAPSHVRELLRRNLGSGRGRDAAPRPNFVADPGRYMLQYASNLMEPRYLAFRGVRDALYYDFARERLERREADGRAGPVRPGGAGDLERRMIWRWEDAQLLESGAGRGIERAERFAALHPTG